MVKAKSKVLTIKRKGVNKSMKASDHVRKLLTSGHKPKELVELGFAKAVVTRVRRQLERERASSSTEAPARPAGEERPAQGKGHTRIDSASGAITLHIKCSKCWHETCYSFSPD